jgi:anionic cell wall polymer biosynthesis LytR-Cps2A-Psr (LCP) family protein
MGFSTSFGITFLVMMVVLGTVCFLSYFRLSRPEEEEIRPDAYLPGPEDRLVMLVAAGEEASMEPDTYLLLGFLPDKGRIALCVLPPSTYLEYGGQGSTLERLWQQGGLGYAQKGLAQYLGIPIDRRATVETADLEQLMSYGGLLDYDLPVDLNYTLHGRQIVMPRGRYQLDGRKAMDIISYPAYKGGERERSDRAALLISQIITHNLPAFLTDTGNRIQETALSILDTDLSAADCLQRSDALQFLARLELPATTTVFLEGSLSRDYTVYHLTDDCKARIREMYCLPSQEDEGEESQESSQGESGASSLPPAQEETDQPQNRTPILDSGEPPIQDQPRMETPYVKFR